MLEHLTEITAVDPAATGRTSDEMLRFVLRWIANALAEVFSARNIGHRGPPVKREGYRWPASSRSTISILTVLAWIAATTEALDLVLERYS